MCNVLREALSSFPDAAGLPRDRHTSWRQTVGRDPVFRMRQVFVFTLPVQPLRLISASPYNQDTLSTAGEWCSGSCSHMYIRSCIFWGKQVRCQMSCQPQAHLRVLPRHPLHRILAGRFAGNSQVVSSLIGIIITTKLLYKKTLETQVKTRKEHNEAYLVGSALLRCPEHHDGLLCRTVSGVCRVCISGVWWLRGHGCVDWHWTGVGRIPPSSSPRRLPRLSLWRVFGAWTVATVSEYSAESCENT